MAIHSQRSHEGYLLIDHRNSPGVRPSDIGGAAVPGVGVGLLETSTFTCPHCHQQVVVVRKRSARKTEPNYCARCDRRTCNRPACVLHCRNMNSWLDRLMERAFKFLGREDNPEARHVYITDGGV